MEWLAVELSLGVAKSCNRKTAQANEARHFATNWQNERLQCMTFVSRAVLFDT